MPRQPNKPHRKLTGADFTARYQAEKTVQRQRYCEAFALWRRCTKGRCRRERACTGDASACLKRAFVVIPRDAQWQAREKILAAMPKNLGAPERAARQCMPLDLYVESAAQAVGKYLARFEQKGPSATR